jgi:hypothetical protein
MHSIHVILYVSVSIFSYSKYPAALADVVPSAQLMPEGLAAFGNFDVLSVRHDGDEDVVHLLQRGEGDSDCDSDCLTYSAFSDDEVMKCRGDVGVNEFEPELPGNLDDDVDAETKKRSLVPRGRKPPKKLCENMKIPNTDAYFEYVSPTWPGTDALEEVYPPT